jgi:hypothetical protein
VNLLKRLLIQASAFNVGLWMRTLFGVGTPRALQGRFAALVAVLRTLWSIPTTGSRCAGPSRLDYRGVATRRMERLPLHENVTCATGC